MVSLQMKRNKHDIKIVRNKTCQISTGNFVYGIQYHKHFSEHWYTAILPYKILQMRGNMVSL